MLIILIWLGSLFPEKYYNVIEKCEEYPKNQCVLLGEGHWFHYLKKYRSMLNVTDDRITRMVLVERADVLRLLYLYDKGGLYTDLDNDIDYSCLHDFVGTRNESFFSQEQKQPQLPSNNLIYAPSPHDPKIERVIRLIQECPTCDGLNFASPYFLKRITVDFVDVKKCVNHLYHSSWYWWADWEGKNISPASAQAYAKCVKDLSNCEILNKNCTQNSSAQLLTSKKDTENLQICRQSSRNMASLLQTCRSNHGICLKELQTFQQKNSTIISTSEETEPCKGSTQRSFEWTTDHTIIAFVFLVVVLAIGIFVGFLFERRKGKNNQTRKIMVSSEMESVDRNFT